MRSSQAPRSCPICSFDGGSAHTVRMSGRSVESLELLQSTRCRLWWSRQAGVRGLLEAIRCGQSDRKGMRSLTAQWTLFSPSFQIQRSIRVTGIVRFARPSLHRMFMRYMSSLVEYANSPSLRSGSAIADLGRDLRFEEIRCRRPVTQVNCFFRCQRLPFPRLEKECRAPLLRYR